MINANVVFWIFTALFALVGWMRGWQREIIATASLVLAVFALNFANQGDRLTNFVQPTQGGQNSILRGNSTNITEPDRIKIERFMIQAIPFFLIAFFGYLGPAVTRQISAGRFPDKARIGIQEGIVGGLIGGFNGYLIISTLAYFAYRQGMLLDTAAFPTVVAGASPPTTILFVPLLNGEIWAQQFFIENAAYVILSGPTLIIALVVLFLFVIIAFI